MKHPADPVAVTISTSANETSGLSHGDLFEQHTTFFSVYAPL
jgi:hypothetical protein